MYRHYEELAMEVAKDPDIKKIKRMVHNPVTAAGNILTWKKLDVALNKVRTMVSQVQQSGDQRLVKYALYFIASFVASRSEMPQYMKVSKSVKL